MAAILLVTARFSSLKFAKYAREVRSALNILSANKGNKTDHDEFR
ncbi:hypothetical protein C8D77_11253 [Mesorhizobium loti]|uniref:Uncharacterized protein n=1 Tax=Rhizobium loti TaxID=381 RepID=A0A8E2WA37_RHILI|nr:hypothetical protein C8D77_11253 [Mesorhizobium loti]